MEPAERKLGGKAECADDASGGNPRGWGRRRASTGLSDGPQPAGALAVARFDEPRCSAGTVGRIWMNGGSAVRSWPRFRLASTAP